MKAIIVSGMPAVGKTTVAKAVSQRFGLKLCFGGDILKEMAIERGFKPSGVDWWDSSQGMKFLEERRRNHDLDKEADRRLIEAVKQGDVVVTSYTLPWLIDEGVKIWLKASVENRARRMALRDRISYEDALKIVRDRDLENIGLYKEIYGIGFGEDLSIFNFIIDTDNLSEDGVIEIVCRIIELLR